jgi:hypothetical protein
MFTEVGVPQATPLPPLSHLSQLIPVPQKWKKKKNSTFHSLMSAKFLLLYQNTRNWITYKEVYLVHSSGGWKSRSGGHISASCEGHAAPCMADKHKASRHVQREVVNKRAGPLQNSPLQPELASLLKKGSNASYRPHRPTLGHWGI